MLYLFFIYSFNFNILKKTITFITESAMRTAFLSDVHSNLEALIAVVSSLRENRTDKVIFLGDIVGYGANPNECIRLIDGISDIILVGNHDWACAGKNNIGSFNPRAKKAALWTRNKLTDKNRAFLLSLPLKEKTDTSVYVHSTPYFPESWDYVPNTEKAQVCFESFSQKFCFLGHTHIPVIFILENRDQVIKEKTGEIIIREDSRYIINCGSVGQPRDKNTLACYGIYDSEKEKFSIKRVAYDIKKTQKKIIGAGLPPFLAKRLELGK